MSKQQLSVELLKSMGYDNEACQRILDAERAAKLDAVAACERRGKSALTPMQACAGDEVKQRIFHQTRGLVRHLSGCKYDLAPHQPVDIYELDRAMAGSSDLDSRCAVKSSLAQLGLIQ